MAMNNRPPLTRRPSGIAVCAIKGMVGLELDPPLAHSQAPLKLYRIPVRTIKPDVHGGNFASDVRGLPTARKRGAR